MDLPTPVGPTMATDSPASIRNETSSRTRVPSNAYDTTSARTSRGPSGSGTVSAGRSTVTGSSSTRTIRSCPTTARGSSERIQPMNRIGHARRPNSATTCTRVPSVTSPVDSRQEPIASTAIVAIEGSASSARLESRPDEARPDAFGPELLGPLAEALDLRALAAEGLDDQGAVDRLVGDGRDLADPLLGAARRSLHLARERAVHQRESGDHQQADQHEEDVGEGERDERERDETQRPDRERDRVEHLDRRLDVRLHVGEELPRRRRAVVAEREVAVAVAHPVPERRRRRRAEDPAVVPPDADAGRAKDRQPHDRPDREPDRAGGDPRPERRTQDAVGDPAEGHRHRDRGDRVHERAGDRDQKRSRMCPDLEATIRIPRPNRPADPPRRSADIHP